MPALGPVTVIMCKCAREKKLSMRMGRSTIWILLVCVDLGLIDTAPPPNITVLAQIDGYHKEFYCVIDNDDSALTWVTSRLDENPPSFYMDGTLNTLCDMDIKNECSHEWATGQWECAQSLDYFSEPIFDHRWERFKMIETGDDYELITNRLIYDNFEMAFSLRIEKDANIFLCDNKKPYNANCYWFIIGGWKGSKNVVRKCAEKEIPKSKEDFPDPPCKTPLDEKNDTESRVSIDQWRHFILKGEKQTYTIRTIGENQPFLTYTDRSGAAFQPNHLIIKSRGGSEGIWKFHLYPFLLTSKEGQTQLGPLLEPSQGTICLAMFTKMCAYCSLHLTLINSAGDVVHVKQYQNEKWTQIKFSKGNLSDGKYRLNVTTKGWDSNKYWAIDDVRSCTDKDVRVVKINYSGRDIPSSSCYYVARNDVKIELRRLNYIETSDSTCPENTFGRSCIPCNEILSAEFCKHSVCELAEDASTKCTCSAGYYGSKCDRACDNHNYGFGCKQKCGHCFSNQCSFVNGYCVSCESGYSGKTCKTPRIPVLKYHPVITVGHTSIVIQLKNTEYEGQYPPSNYQMFIQRYGERNGQYTSEYSIDDTNPKKIEGLTADTTYIVWVLLRTSNDNYNAQFATQLEVTTTCAALKKENIEILSANTSAAVTIQTTSESCPLNEYKLFFERNAFVLTSKSFRLLDLLPYKQYNVTLLFLRTKETLAISFTTLEGRPTSVRNLTVSESTPTEINVTWEVPETANGIIRHYKVTYMHKKYLGCQYEVRNADSKTDTTSQLTFKLKSLLPYSEYTIQVVGVTTVEGFPAHITFGTLQEDVPNRKELPSLSLNHLVRYTRVLLKHENCESIRGPLIYHVTFCCSNQWCDCKTKNLTATNAGASADFLIFAYSNYSVEVKVQRTNGNYLEQKLTEDFLSAPTAPHAVLNLTLYSKTKSSVSLRWFPPYPPTGVLKDYIIHYQCTSCWSTKTGQVVVADNQCKLWSEFLCATVTIPNYENNDFVFTMCARNEDPDKHGTCTDVKGKLAVGKPQPPKSLTAEWDDYNNLTLSWIHPDITNGPLTDFPIEISGIPTTTYKSQEQLVYSHTVTNAPPSMKLLVAVAAETKAGRSSPIRIETYSPPKIPAFSDVPYVQEVDNSTLTMIMPAVQDLANDSMLYVIVTELNTQKPSEIPKRIEAIADVDGHHFSWIATETPLYGYTGTQRKIQVGLDQIQYSNRLELQLYDRPLKMGTNYTVTFLLSNTYMNKTRSSVKKIACMTAGMYQEEKVVAYLGLLGLLALPLLCLVGFILFRKHKIRIPMRPIMENLRSIGDRTNPDVIPLAEAELPQTRQQPIRPKPKPPTAVKPTGGAKFSRLVKLVDFEAYVKEALQSGELERQHAMFPRGATHPWEDGTKPYNKTKNRYNNLAAYDHTRVKLEMTDGNVMSDYINANYIEGYNVSRAYIATQGPKLATVDDFWRMIWQEGVEYIIMLANVFENGKKKVEKYWPDINQTLEFGPIKVHYVSVEVFADYESRKFSVTCNDQERKIKQLHFMSWPDHGVPLYAQSLVPLLRKMLTIPHGKSPVVVHCSAGVGRTGTIILCDICLRMAAREGEVDVLYHQYKIREQRVNMVDNIEQYKLVHLVLLQCLVAPQTNLACTEEIGIAVEQILSGDALDFQMKYLDDTAWQDIAMRPNVTNEISPVYPEKNRFKDIVPDEICRVFLSPFPTSDDTSSYINAIKVDGFQALSKYIVTQQPLPNTVGDFWRLVHEKNISVIVSLNTIEPEDETCCQFWPTEAVATLEPVPYLKVTYTDLMTDACYDVVSAYLVDTNAEDGERRALKIFNFKNWCYDQYHPEDPSQLLTAVEEVNRLGKSSKCILVTCHDGARASGLFVALTFVIDKIKLEQECDVCLAVRNVRRSRNEFIRNKDQFAFLYRAAAEYVNGFKIYSNFVSGKK